MSDDGVQFSDGGGGRSTQRTGKDVFARAAAAVDADLAAAISGADNWRTSYPQHLRKLTERAAMSARAALVIARAGLDRVHETFEFAAGGIARPLPEVMRAAHTRLETRTTRGRGKPAAGLAVPYSGERLRTVALVRQLEQWVADGVVEPAFAAAIIRVLEHPGWLDLTGTWFAVLGAGAEMAPTEWLLRWGADVVAVDIPRADIWRRLEALAERGTGRLHVPVRPVADRGADEPGVDLLTRTPDVVEWLEQFDRPLIVGNYAYAAGETFARLAVAADALFVELQRRRGDVSVAYLATPTDTFAVGPEVVQFARERQRRTGWVPGAAGLVRRVSRNRLLVPNYRETVRTDDGDDVGIADGLILQQGPNYALAKRLQRWRADVAHDDGAFSALHVAPPTRTRSVLHNRVIAAAYAGASLFDVETFEPATSRALMAALLVHDLRRRDEAATGQLAQHHRTAAAAHGGLWRMAWEPRSALPLAVVRGASVLLRR